MQDLYELKAPTPEIRQAMDALCLQEADFTQIEAVAGPVTCLELPLSFAALVRIIVGQQLSTQVARSIYRRLEQLTDFEPAAYLSLSDHVLKTAGLSQAKLLSTRTLAAALAGSELDLAALADQSEENVFKRLTALKGLGPWSAQLFMLFALKRQDIFPAGDLALQKGYSRLKNLEPALNARQLEQAAQTLSPYRSAAAHLIWHYYRHLTLFGKF